VLIGKLSIPIFGFTFSLGLTGGVLLAAIILSRIGKTGNMLWNVSGSSNQLLRKLGLIFFLVAVGTDAGGHLMETLRTGGISYFAAGAIITIFSNAAYDVHRTLFIEDQFPGIVGSINRSYDINSCIKCSGTND
jgi:putative transport protein